MFRGLHETIRNLNADLNNVTNCKRAKKLRKTLLSVGLPLVLFAFAGAIFCLVMFVKGGYENLKKRFWAFRKGNRVRCRNRDCTYFLFVGEHRRYELR